MRDKSRGAVQRGGVQDQDELDARARFKTMTDRTGQTLTVAAGSLIETALVVRSASISDPLGVADGVTEHSRVAHDGRLAGSVVQRYELGGHWSQPQPDGVAFERIAT